MGAQSFIHVITAQSPSEAFSMLVNDAICSHGNGSYNGTISTCELGKCVISFDKYTSNNKAKAFKKIEQLQGGEKWKANYIDLGVKSYNLVTYEKTKYDNSPKFKLGYAVYNGSSYVGSYETKKEAEASAIKSTLNTLTTTTIKKEYYKIQRDDTVQRISPKCEELKSKPKKIKESSKLIEHHEYIFFGWASC